MDSIISKVKKRNENKDINCLPHSENIIDSKFYGLGSIKSILKDFRYVDNPDFFIPIGCYIYFIKKSDPLFILKNAGTVTEFNLLYRKVKTSRYDVCIDSNFLFIRPN